MRRLLVALVATLLALVGVSACSSTPAETIDTTGAVVVDVRTPAEFAEGHLEGAVNIDVEDQVDFAAALISLPKDQPYVVYCRSGNRSAAATQQMVDAGFTDVTDAGGLQAASDSTGLPIVSG